MGDDADALGADAGDAQTLLDARVRLRGRVRHEPRRVAVGVDPPPVARQRADEDRDQRGLAGRALDHAAASRRVERNRSGSASSSCIQSSISVSTSVHAGLRDPAHALHAEPGRGQLAEDRGVRDVGREVGEELRVLPVRQARHDDAVAGRRAPSLNGSGARRRVLGQLGADLARLHRRRDRCCSTPSRYSAISRSACGRSSGTPRASWAPTVMRARTGEPVGSVAVVATIELRQRRPTTSRRCARSYNGPRHTHGVPRVIEVDEMREEIDDDPRRARHRCPPRVSRDGELAGFAYTVVPAVERAARALSPVAARSIRTTVARASAGRCSGGRSKRATEQLRSSANRVPKFIRVNRFDYIESAHRLFRRMGFTPARYFDELSATARRPAGSRRSRRREHRALARRS